MKQMPFGYKPPFTAWTAVFPEDMTHLIYAQFGVQGTEMEDAKNLFQTIRNSFDLPHGPRLVERAVTTDANGCTNWIWLAYWDSTSIYEAWLEQAAVQAWFDGPDTDSKFGYWREVLTIPTTNFESIYSTLDHRHGIASFLDVEVTTMHAYWGGMRDRIPASETSDLDSPFGKDLPQPVERETYGKRLKVIAPDNVALIRTAQDWTRCAPDERVTYIDKVQPTLFAGAAYLRDNSAESGCISARLVFEKTLEGDETDQTCVVGYFLSLAHLEAWSKSHPTHLEIFRAFFNMLAEHNNTTQLELWHEVSVLSSKNMDLFYVNCHPHTGFLPYFELVEVQAGIKA